MFNLTPPDNDGLHIDEVGEWSEDKHYFLQRYIDAFTTAMKNKGWFSLHYIDLFAGSGIKRIKTTSQLHWGSPLIAAQAPNPFSRLHLCEKNSKIFQALEIRVKQYREDSQILYGDANVKVHEILREIPSGSLSLAFLDPHGLHLAYETLSALSAKRSDLIIFFPDHLDALRNWETYYFDNPDSNLDLCLGKGTDWREKLSQCPQDSRVDCLREMYELQIRKLGYEYFEYERIYRQKIHPLYRLIFCSKSDVGAKIWRRASKKKSNGQYTFDFKKD